AVKIDDHAIRFQGEYAPMLRSVFMHLISNSIDHAFSAHTDRTYTVTMDISIEHNNIIFNYSDNGSGLDMVSLREKGINNGFLATNTQLTESQEIANQLLKSGISTAHTITDVSGRGVGMNAVDSYVKELGGDIKVILIEKSLEFCPFFFQITLPDYIAINLAS
ncbi:unnamed protein product, partial [marine sediment metagenome]